MAHLSGASRKTIRLETTVYKDEEWVELEMAMMKASTRAEYTHPRTSKWRGSYYRSRTTDSILHATIHATRTCSFTPIAFLSGASRNDNLQRRRTDRMLEIAMMKASAKAMYTYWRASRWQKMCWRPWSSEDSQRRRRGRHRLGYHSARTAWWSIGRSLLDLGVQRRER